MLHPVDCATTSTAAPTTTTTTTPLSEFEQLVEAEDATTRMSGGATFDNQYGGYTGDGYVDFGSNPGESVTWRIHVPVSGRYELRWRYALSGLDIAPLRYKHEHISVNHKFTSSIDFNPTATGSWDTWSMQADVVELTAGINFVTLETTDTSGPHVDSLTVNYIASMAHCTPGETVQLSWFVSAGQKSHVTHDASTGTTYTTLLNSIEGTMAGVVDLGKLGPWDVKFKVVAAPSGAATDTLGVSINGKQSSIVHQNIAGGEKGFHFETRRGHVSFSFEWDSLSAAWGSHMQLLDGTATCAGCSHVRCRYTTGGDHDSERLVIYHHADEMEGSKHKCGWNAGHEACLCECGSNTSLQTGPWESAPTDKAFITHFDAMNNATSGASTHGRIDMFNKTLTAPAQTGTQCMRPDWYATMNLFAPNDSPWLNQETRGWSHCVDGNGILQRGSFLHGLYKGDCSDNGLGCIEKAECCDTAWSRNNASKLDCYEADWSTSMSQDNTMSACDNGYFLTGLKRGMCTDLHCLEKAKCCKRPGTAWGTCEERQAFPVGNDAAGWRSCADGSYMAGLRRGSSNDISGLEAIKCCTVSL